MNNNQRELQTTLRNILSSMGNEYYIDLYLPDYIQPTGVDLSDRNKLIENTIAIYKKHHDTFNDKRIKQIIIDLKEVVKNDVVIYFEQTYIYRELYKILFHIDATLKSEILLLDPRYPYGFAKIQSDRKKIDVFRRHEKKNLVGDFRLTNRKESRLKYWALSLYHHSPNLVNFFLHAFIVADLIKLKALYENEDASKLILSDMEFFLMQKTTILAVTKNLGILLYGELTHFLKIHPTQAEVHLQSIIYELFRGNVNAYEFKKQIILKSSLGFFPIFGASKKFNLKSEEQFYIKRKLFNELQTLYQLTPINP